MTEDKMPGNFPIRVVVIGGGTGNATILAGLKPWVGGGLTAIVNNFDDGGGAGKLRDAYTDLSAVGDLRQCAEAMSDALPEARELFNFRFPNSDGSDELWLHGQTLGNLMITAAVQQNGGHLSKALELIGRMFDIRGRVVPASNDNRRLVIELPDGQVIEGEQNAEEADVPSFRGAKVGFDQAGTRISDEARRAIQEADMVVIAPGDLYTSLAGPLSVGGMREALLDAKLVVHVANLMNRNRHTVDFSVLDHVLEYERIIRGGEPTTGARQRIIDGVVCNNQSLDAEALRLQAVRGSRPTTVDTDGLKKAGYVVYEADLLSQNPVKHDPNDMIAETRSTIRHDSRKAADALMAFFFNSELTHRSRD